MRESIKTDLLKAIKNSGDDGKYSDDAYEDIQRLVKELATHTPMPRPVDNQDEVTGQWEPLYAQFGPRHTAGKSIEHDNMFHFVSWSALPKLPFRNFNILQEIHHDSFDYNNIHVIEPVGGGLKAYYTVYGRYVVEADAPQRYKVDFYRAKLTSRNNESDEQIRSAFGFEKDQSLDLKLKAPPLHSDIVYCDGDVRINFGSVGGIYVMQRTNKDMVSVMMPRV